MGAAAGAERAFIQVWLSGGADRQVSSCHYDFECRQLLQCTLWAGLEATGQAQEPPLQAGASPACGAESGGTALAALEAWRVPCRCTRPPGPASIPVLVRVAGEGHGAYAAPAAHVGR